MTAAVYTMIGVTGSNITQRTVRGAPSDARICSWGKRRNASFVARYFPSRRGWMVYDIRMATPIHGLGYTRWVGYVRSTKVYATEDIAVMVMVHLSNVEPHPELAL